MPGVTTFSTTVFGSVPVPSGVNSENQKDCRKPRHSKIDDDRRSAENNPDLAPQAPSEPMVYTVIVRRRLILRRQLRTAGFGLDFVREEWVDGAIVTLPEDHELMRGLRTGDAIHLHLDSSNSITM